MNVAKIVLSAAAVLTVSLAANAAHAAACTAQAVTATDIPTWKSPQKGTSCTMADATAFETAVNNQNATPDMLEASVSAGCKSCIFTEDGNSSPTWQLFVWMDKANNDGIFNTSACLAAAGASNACASANYGAETCDETACQACTDSTTYDTCAMSAETGTCKTYASSAQSSCDASTDNAFNACDMGQNGMFSVKSLVMTLCGGGDTGSTGGTGGGTGTGSGSGSGSSSNDTGGSGTGSSSGGGSGSSSGSGSNKGTGSSSNNSSGGSSGPEFGSSAPQAGGCNAAGGSANDAFGALLGIAACAIAMGAARRRRSA
jgi:hypothetical protein